MRTRGAHAPLVPFGVDVEYDETEPALAIHPDIQIIAIGISAEVLSRIDMEAIELEENPNVSHELRALPMWALRSNIIGEAINSHYEMLDLRRTWNEE